MELSFKAMIILWFEEDLCKNVVRGTSEAEVAGNRQRIFSGQKYPSAL